MRVCDWRIHKTLNDPISQKLLGLKFHCLFLVRMVLVAWALKLLKLLEGKYILCITHMYVFFSQQQVKPSLEVSLVAIEDAYFT